MNFSPFFLFLNTIKTLHWLTSSYAHHKILDEAYGDFSDKIDEFVESCIGANSPRKYEDITLTFVMPEDEEDIVIMFERAFDEFSTKINKYANTPSLESLIDDFNNIANKTSYLLKMT